jgi:hypothetical protein
VDVKHNVVSAHVGTMPLHARLEREARFSGISRVSRQRCRTRPALRNNRMIPVITLSCFAGRGY